MRVLRTPVQLTSHLYIVYSEFPHVDCGNIYLITGDKPTLIDCGSSRGVDQLIRNLDQLGLQAIDLAQVIVTHGDYDHVQGFHKLREVNPDLQLLLHPKDWPIVQGDEVYGNSSYLYDLPFIPIIGEQCLPLEDGDVVSAGSTTLTAHHTPGHTEGSVCLYGEIDGNNVLFAGDTIGGAMKSLEGANLPLWVDAAKTWRRSLQKISALDYQWVLTGHEPVESLPLSRAHVDRLVRSFGKMLNPWFTLAEDERPIALVGEPA